MPKKFKKAFLETLRSDKVPNFNFTDIQSFKSDESELY